MRPRCSVSAACAAATALLFSASASAAVTPGWQCVPTTAGQAVVSGGTGPTPSCSAGATPVLAPTYVASGVGGKPTVQFAAVNVQILNGAGSTASTNGTGNVVLGYNESPGAQTGSHDLVLGSGQTFTSYGGIVAGSLNSVTGPFGATFGRAGKATGHNSLVAGQNNSASGTATSALGGYKNVARGTYSSVTGGCANLTGSGPATAVPSTCADNTRTSNFASIAGGAGNQATGVSSSIFGGSTNVMPDAFGFGPSDVSNVLRLNPTSGSTGSGLHFLSSRVLHFSGARTTAHVDGSVGLQSLGAGTIGTRLGVCWQPVEGGGLTMTGFVSPAFHQEAFDTTVQSVSGVVDGLQPGNYNVGLCAQGESSNLSYGYGSGTITLAESNTPVAPPDSTFGQE